MIKMKLNIQLFALTPYDTEQAEIYSQNSTGSGGYRHRVILLYYFHVDPSTRKYTLYARERFYHQTSTDNWSNGSPYNRLLMDGTVMCTTKNNLGSHSSGGTMDLCPSFNGSSWQNMGTFSYSDMGKGNTHTVGVSCGYASSWAGISRKTTNHSVTPPDIDPANNILNSVADFNIDDGFTPNITNYGLSSYMSIANVTTGFDYAVSNGTSCKLEAADKSDIIGLLNDHNYIDLSFTLQTKNGDTQVGTSGPKTARCTVPLTTFTVEKDGSTQGKYNFSRTNYGLYDTVTVLYGSHEIIAEQAYTSSITLTANQLTTVYGYMPSTSENLTFRFKTYKNSTKAKVYQSVDKLANITMPDYSPSITALTYSDSVTTYNSKKVNATDIIATLSKPNITVTLSNNYNNSYSSVTCNGVAGSISGRTATFSAINQASSYKIKITDNRGKSSETTYNGSAYTDSIKTVPWFAPSISKITITRPDGPVGTRAQAVVTGTFYSGSNLTGLTNATLQVQYSYDNETWSSFTSATSTNGKFNQTFTLSGDSNFYKKPIYIKAKITDRIGVAMSNWSSANIPSGQPVFNTYRDSAGNSYMRINSTLNIDGSLNCGSSAKASLLDFIYPVGSVFISTSSDFNTAAKVQAYFGGRWSAIPNGYYLYNVTSGAGSTFGSGTSGSTTLTAAQSGLPAHSHGLNSHTHGVGGLGITTTATTKTLTGQWRSTKARFPGGSSQDNNGIFKEWVANQSTYWSSGGGKDDNTVGWKIDARHEHTGTINDNQNTGAASGNTADNSAANASQGHTHSIEPKGYKVYCYVRTA